VVFHVRLDTMSMVVGNVIQILFSSPLEAKFLYKELFERYKREQARMKRD